ncbi:DNA excision repair protein ERCC-2 [Halovenus aranensis]|uniref:DNA excision repair protein ERCC-2 n=1 Tax=Halovenus aranensis TaxID=890420 RepID=A0A1G8RPS8_9EURY|nr:ATP-dependent DNA helicase [Halovenus aranensis]SDJ18991.1 DNA excision repair protein ERCC-2 [Halovenus aranensis]
MSQPSYLRYFPYDSPYDHQREAMAQVYEALDDGTDILFEGATGTGKTLASLIPALEYARKTDKTVVITTNVHQQMRQFRREASAIAATQDVRAVVFRGKSSMCHIDVGYEECQALRDTTRDLVDAEQELADLERKQRDLLDRSQQGDSDATEARAAVMDELDAAEDELAEFEEQATCDHYYRNLTTDTTEFFAWLYDDVRTPDDIYEYAHERGLCGYELLKEGVEGVDLVVCNYHHLLDPMIREQFFRWLGRDPEDVIAIFDEAHNVEDAARDHARKTLTENTIVSALDELEEADDRRSDGAYNLISTFLRALRETYERQLDEGAYDTDVPGPEQIDDHWTDLSIANEDRRDDLTLTFLQSYSGPGYEQELEEALDLGNELDRQYDQAYRNGETSVRKECQTLQTATFLESWLGETDETGTYPVVSLRREQRGGDVDERINDTKGDIYGRVELYTCIPEQVTQSLFDDLHASALMSATLRPFDVTEDVLGLDDPETMAYGAQFPESRRRTYAVDGPALFASNRDDRDVQETVTSVLEDTARMTPGNTLAFFPSYGEAARYHERVTTGTTYLDEPGTPAQELREQFTDDDAGILFTSLWGTLGEGVSYDGDDARSVVVVGVPYPHLDDRMDAVQRAYEAEFGDAKEEAGWRYAVEIPTVRKTRQALGRVVRSPEDFGARILLDARYTERAEIEMPEYAVRGTFPPEERNEMIDVDPAKLKFGLLNFYGDMDAYGGDPPTP